MDGALAMSRRCLAACLLVGASGLAIPAITLKRASTGDPVDLRAAVTDCPGRTLVVYGARLRIPQPAPSVPPTPSARIGCPHPQARTRPTST